VQSVHIHWKQGEIVGSKARFLYKHVGNKKAKTTHPGWQRAQFTIVRMMCIKKMNQLYVANMMDYEKHGLWVSQGYVLLSQSQEHAHEALVW